MSNASVSSIHLSSFLLKLINHAGNQCCCLYFSQRSEHTMGSRETSSKSGSPQARPSSMHSGSGSPNQPRTLPPSGPERSMSEQAIGK